MLLIPCPFCGPRHEAEFVCGGERLTTRPMPPQAIADEAWLTRMMTRENRRGPHTEMWWHAKGCGLWFPIQRDTLTHELLSPSAGETTP